VALTDRRTLPVPYGHRVFVINDLLLSPQTDPSSRPVHELVNLLNDTDDAAIVVLAGNIFDVSPTTDLRKFINATFAQLSELDAAVAHFVSGGQRAIVLLPGAVDTEISTDDLAHAVLNERHIQIASDLILQVASAHDVRDVAFIPPTVPTLADSMTQKHFNDLSPRACCTGSFQNGCGSHFGPWPFLT
jgi:hypothetical protein